MTLKNLIRVMPVEGRMSETASHIAITLNGQVRRLPGTNVANLLAGLGLDSSKVAVERNESIVPRSLYAQTRLAQGDHVEIVHFIGGG